MSATGAPMSFLDVGTTPAASGASGAPAAVASFSFLDLAVETKAEPAAAGTTNGSGSEPKKDEKKKGKKAKEKPPEAPPITTGTTVLPAPKPPTDVEVAKASAAVEAAVALGGREKITAEIIAVFDAEDLALADLERLGDPESAEARAALVEALRKHEQMVLEHDGLVAERLKEALKNAATIGHAIEEIKHWQAEAARVNRLYEALKEKSAKKADRVEKWLMPFVVQHCDATRPDKGSATWTFPTTQWTVVRSMDHTGVLAVTNHDAAAEALKQHCGPAASKAIEVKTTVYIREARKLLEGVRVGDKPLDLSTVRGFQYTPPGGTDYGIGKGK